MQSEQSIATEVQRISYLDSVMLRARACPPWMMREVYSTSSEPKGEGLFNQVSLLYLIVGRKG
jgi:hypothetical protein